MSDKNLNVEQVKHAKIGNKEIDFNQLYLEVTKRGGYHYCIQSKLFDQVFVSLQCFQPSQTKYANQVLQQLYSKYLYDYERKYFNQMGQQLSPVQSIHHSQSKIT